MPLRVIRKRVTGSNALGFASTLAQMASDLSNISQFPLACLAASLLQVIVETIKDVESNKEDCIQLARRSIRMLKDLRNRMEDKWENAPKALLDNIHGFEETLVSIRDYMAQMAKVKWVGRILQKSSIESDLRQFDRQLDEAERSFQLASLIEIHYAVGMLQRHAQLTAPLASSEVVPRNEMTLVGTFDAIPESKAEDPIVRTASPELFNNLDIGNTEASTSETANDDSAAMVLRDASVDEVDDGLAELRLRAEIAEIDSFGFQKYHRSDVRLRNDMKKANGFWSNSSVADVGGKRSIVKRYEGERSSAVKVWLHDIKSLNNIFHANLPQLIGISDEDAPNLFIILAHVQLIEINPYVWQAIQTESLASCVDFMLRMYRDISSAALYVQRQMNLQDNEAQDWVDDSTYNLDRDRNIVIGLPPPRSTRWISARSCGLTESIVDRSLKALPSLSRVEGLTGKSSLDGEEIRNKFIHLQTLIRALLPVKGQSARLREDVENLIMDDEPMSLTALRSVNLKLGNHDHYWHDNVTRLDVQFTTGDIGYIPRDQLRQDRKFNSFVKVSNVFDEKGSSSLQLVTETQGTQLLRIEGVFPPQWSDVYPFLLPNEIEGWTAAIPPNSEVGISVKRRVRIASINASWQHLLLDAPRLANIHGVDPEELILVTGTSYEQMYKIHRRQMSIGGMHNRPGSGMQSAFHSPSRSGYSHGFGNPPPTPLILYLFTSAKDGFEPYWSQNPMGSPPGIPHEHRYGMLRQTDDWPYYSINYVQLYKEDFH